MTAPLHRPITPAPGLRIRRRLVASIVGAAMVLAACGSGDSSTATPAAMSESDVLSSAQAEITPNPADEQVGVWHLLGESADDPIVLVEVSDDTSPVDLRADTELADGRPVELALASEPGSLSSARLMGPTGQQVVLRSFELDVDELVALAEEITVDGRELDVAADGWEALTSIAFPAYVDGYTTRWDFGADGAVSIDLHRQQGDEMILAAFGPTEPDTINGQPARRYRDDSGLQGFVFEIDDEFLVDLRFATRPGMFSDDDVRAVAESIRTVDPPS